MGLFGSNAPNPYSITWAMSRLVDGEKVWGIWNRCCLLYDTWKSMDGLDID